VQQKVTEFLNRKYFEPRNEITKKNLIKHKNTFYLPLQQQKQTLENLLKKEKEENKKWNKFIQFEKILSKNQTCVQKKIEL
jgi:hypothetical protein